MSVHALFRMALSLFPIQLEKPVIPKPSVPSSAPPVLPTPAPVQTAEQSPEPFRPSHALYSSVTQRHAALRNYRHTYAAQTVLPNAHSATSAKAADDLPRDTE